MVNTFQAFAVFLIAVLPGALYTWGVERICGQWGLRASDRVLRFVGISVLFQILFLPLTYYGYTKWIKTGQLAAGDVPIRLLLPISAIYVLVPFAAGTLIGQATHRSWEGWLWRLVVGPAPAPRAWDHVFGGHNVAGWVRARLENGNWIGGWYGGAGRNRSYAAGFPYDPQDLYIAECAAIDPDGYFVKARDGRPALTGAGALVRWESVSVIYFAKE